MNRLAAAALLCLATVGPLAALPTGPLLFSYPHMDAVAGQPGHAYPGVPADTGFLPLGFSAEGKFGYLTAEVFSANGRYGVALHVIDLTNPAFNVVETYHTGDFLADGHQIAGGRAFDDLPRGELVHVLVNAAAPLFEALLVKHGIPADTALELRPLPLAFSGQLYHVKLADTRYAAQAVTPAAPPVIEGYTVALYREPGICTPHLSATRHVVATLAGVGVLNRAVMGAVVSPDARYLAVVVAEERVSFVGDHSLFGVQVAGTALSELRAPADALSLD